MREVLWNQFNLLINNDKVSIADEIREFSKPKQEGILSDEEFTEMKEDLIE